MVINAMQIGFKFWHELLKDKTNEEQKEKFYLFFFYSFMFNCNKSKSIFYNYF